MKGDKFMKKTIIIFLLFAILLCSVSCMTPNASDASAVSLYDGIIERYSELLNKKANGQTIPDPDADASEIEVALCKIIQGYQADPSLMGYATKDINGDGTPELVLLDKNNKLCALFTIQNHAPVLLLDLSLMTAVITPDGTIYAGSSYVENVGQHTLIKRIVDGKLEGLEFGSVIEGESTSYYKIENGKRTEITFAEKNQLDSSIQHLLITPWYHTKTAGFRFVPAITDSSLENTAPVPDFSTYDGILSAYKTVVECFSEYSPADWVNGKFDSLFHISDDETYEVFHQIFYGGIRVMPTETYLGQSYDSCGDNAYGYAKKDLNNDGIEELILLNDNYKIFAIFTMEDGEAVLVDGIYDVWVDENGFLRKEPGTGGVTGRDAEAFVYKINGAQPEVIVGIGYKVNLYLEKGEWYKTDGNTKTDISDEEGKALYAEYDILPSNYCNKEYSKTYSGIAFVPLFEATLATQEHINTYSNAHFIYGDMLTVSAVSDSDVTASIKFVHSVGEFDPITNTEPEVYTTEISVTASRVGNRYRFEKDGVKGYIEFAVNSAWVIVTESENEHVVCKAYLFDRPEN